MTAPEPILIAAAIDLAIDTCTVDREDVIGGIMHAVRVAAPILIQAGRDAAARDIETYGSGMEYGGIRVHWKKAAQIARGEASREEPTCDLRLGIDR